MLGTEKATFGIWVFKFFHTSKSSYYIIYLGVEKPPPSGA